MAQATPPDASADREPPPLAELSAFEEGEFNALSPRCGSDPQYDAIRLRLRRRLGALAKEFARRAAGEGVGLETRTSLHRPYQFNHGRVRRMWAYVTRDKKAKSGLRKVLGRDLGKDLDAAYRNAYLCLAVEHDALEVSLRMHPDAWYDGQNMKNRVGREGVRSLLAMLNGLQGFRLQLADWKGEWPLGALPIERLEEFLRYWVPGEHLLAVERRFPAPEGARAHALAADVPEQLLAELARLLPLFRWATWSSESDFLGLGAS